MHGTGVRARRCLPGDRPIERQIDLEHPRAVAIAFELAAVALRQARAGDRQHLARREVEQDRARGRQGVDRLDRRPGDDLATERAQAGRQGIGDPLRAATRERPADRVAHGTKDEPEGRARRLFQGQERMSGEPGEQCARVLAAEHHRSQEARRPDRAQTEAEERERMAWEAQRSEDRIGDRIPTADERSHQPPVRPGIPAERRAGRADRTFEHRGRAVVERVRQGGRWMNPPEAMLVQRQGSEKRRATTERMDRRADVVNETGQRQLGRAHSPTDSIPRFEHQHPLARARQGDRGRQAVGPCADHDRIIATLPHRYTTVWSSTASYQVRWLAQ